MFDLSKIISFFFYIISSSGICLGFIICVIIPFFLFNYLPTKSLIRIRNFNKKHLVHNKKTVIFIFAISTVAYYITLGFSTNMYTFGSTYIGDSIGWLFSSKIYEIEPAMAITSFIICFFVTLIYARIMITVFLSFHYMKLNNRKSNLDKWGVLFIYAIFSCLAVIILIANYYSWFLFAKYNVVYYSLEISRFIVTIFPIFSYCIAIFLYKIYHHIIKNRE